jgi:hypothetical protein
MSSQEITSAFASMKDKSGNPSDALSARKDNANIPCVPAPHTRCEGEEIDADGEKRFDTVYVHPL